jgi:hypothetical protein
MRLTNLSDIGNELNAGTPNGLRQMFATATFVNNEQFFTDAHNIAQAVYGPLFSIDNFQMSWVMEPLSKAFQQSSINQGNGGNVLGLAGTQNLVILDLTSEFSQLDGCG